MTAKNGKGKEESGRKKRKRKAGKEKQEGKLFKEKSSLIGEIRVERGRPQ